MRICDEALAHAISQRLISVGPPLSSKRSDRTPPPVASASSWQGLLVAPGGAPTPPGCLTCVVKTAGAAPRPAIKTPH